MGAQLVVQETQEAVFFRDGKALDVFGPGRHTLTTQNIPLLTKVLSLPFGGTSPFRVAVVYVNKRTFLDQKWGTREPVVFRDTELGMVRLRAFGNYAYRIADSQLFINTVVGSQGLFETDRLKDFYRDVIVSRAQRPARRDPEDDLRSAALLRRARRGRQGPAGRGLRQVRRRPDRLLHQLDHPAGRGPEEDRRARRPWVRSAT